MIESADEFIRLRSSDIPEEYSRSAHEQAALSVWFDVIYRFPKFKEWVVYNKTVPIEILEVLASDEDPAVRAAVARKRKIDEKIFSILAKDNDINVRYALICNTKMTMQQLSRIEVSDSDWLTKELQAKLTEMDRT